MSQGDNSNAEDPWVVGSQYAQMVGAPPSSFSTLIRGLVQDRERNSNTISFHQEQAMVRFLKGDSMKAPFYYLLKTFKKDMLNGEPIPPRDIVRSFQPRELAVFIGFLYTYRRTRNRIKNENEWEFLREMFLTRAEVGTFLGYSMPNIGPCLGLIAGGIRFLALTPFILHDEKGYIDYRRHLKKEQVLYDFDYELSRWGCTHAHVATHMLIAMGFDRESALAIGRGLLKTELPEESAGRTEYALKLTELWTTALVQTGKEPEMRHSGNFYPVAEALETLIAEVSKTCSMTSQYCWMEKQKADISFENAPEVFDPNKDSNDEHNDSSAISG